MIMGRFAESDPEGRWALATALVACAPTPAATAPSTDVLTKSRREKVTEAPWVADLRVNAEGYHGWDRRARSSITTEPFASWRAGCPISRVLFTRRSGDFRFRAERHQVSLAPLPRTLTLTSSAGKLTQAPGISCACFLQLIGHSGGNRLRVIGAKAQQRGDISHLVELGIVFDIKHFDIVTNYVGQNGFANIDHLLRGSAAHRTVAHQMSIEVPAGRTLDRVALQAFAHKQGLHFTRLQRLQHAPQARNSASMAA